MTTAAVLSAVYALAESQHGLVALWQARALRLGWAELRHLLDDREWDRMARTVYRLPGTPRTWRQELRAATLAAGPHAIAAHTSAAALWRIAGFADGPVDVLKPFDRSATERLGVVRRSRHLPPGDITAVDAIPVTTLPRTLFDLAAVVSRKRLERAVDSCLARGVSLAALHRVAADLARPGRPGSGRFRAVLEERSEGYVAPASELEALWRDVLRAAGMPEGSRQLDAGDRDGWIGRVDVCYRPARVLVELDGRRHHTALLDRTADQARDNRLMAAGWRVLRFTWRDLVEDPAGVVAVLAGALKVSA